MANFSEVSAPLRILLEKNTAWHWGPDQDESFQKLKHMAINAPVLKYYDAKKPLTLSVDASSKGHGIVLIQDSQPIAYGSRALTETQQRYSQIEKEALAILFGCTKFHEYIFAREVLVETDHKPLQSIFKKNMSQAPPRLQRILLALQKYDLVVTYKPGKELLIADHLSRSYLRETKETLLPDLQVNDVHLISHLPIGADMYKRFQDEIASDEELTLLQDIVLSGWPEAKTDLTPLLYKYWNFRDEISCIDGLLYKSHKVIVPKSLQSEMLDLIHESHLGIVKCQSRAREVVFWLGMSSDIENRVKSCAICSKYQNVNAKEPMLIPDLPDRPWSKLGTDIFEYQGHHYLLVIDYFSKWPEIAKLDNQSSKNTIEYMKSFISRYGHPDTVISDNGPRFSSAEFKQFAHEYSFIHITSSPRFPQSNGQAERAVQTVKNLVKKSTDPYKALLAYRTTPLDIGLSPSQLFLNRRLKTSLPTSAPLLQPMDGKDAKSVQDKLKMRQLKHKFNFDRHCGSELKPLNKGEPVVMLTGDKWSHAEVVSKRPTPRSYIVQTPEGRKFRRNRKHLRPTLFKAKHETGTSLVETGCNENNVVTDNTCVVSPAKTKPVTIDVPPKVECTEIKQSVIPSKIMVSRSGREIKKPTKLNDFVE